MSLALPAVLLLLLALPGFIFVYAYRGRLRPVNEPLVSGTSVNALWVVGFLCAAVSHMIWVPLTNHFASQGQHGVEVDLHSVAYLLGGSYSDTAAFNEAVRSFTEHPYFVASYFVPLYLVAILLGVYLHKAVTYFQLDRRIPLLRFNNKWHYLFWGEEVSATPITDVWITVTCQHADHTCLYAGFLQSYEFSADGQLERLYLAYAARGEFKSSPDDDPKFVDIAGDVFLIWGKNINTLNVDYVRATRIEDRSAESSDLSEATPTSDLN